VPQLEVVPHGIDTHLFHPLGGRSAIRAGIPGLCDLPPEGFVVLNANRSEPRKRIDITLKGFAQFARDKPAGVRLYLHMGETREGNGLRTLVGELGIGNRVVLASTEAGGHPRLDDAALNRLYNACDVGLNTASSEGWGMISFEHAATGAAQIVPGTWVCGEIWRDHAELLPAAPGGQTCTRYTKEIAVSADDVAAALERLYADGAHRRAMAERAACLATMPSFQWSAIGSRLDSLLSTLCFPE
jgi:glycosyltransferase involved in cell wall biosynthesis